MTIIKLTAKCKNVCCPTLEIDQNTREVVIFDDYSGSVRMSQAQFGSLAEQYLEHKMDAAGDRPESDSA